MNKKILLFLVLGAVLANAVLTGCSRESKKFLKVSKESTKARKAEVLADTENPDEAKIVLKYGDVNPEGHILLDSAEFFRDKVKELSGGRIEVVIYPSGQLGDDNKVYQAMQMGNVDLYRGNASSLTDFGNLEIGVLALPYIYRDREHFWAVANSELGDRILNNIQESGSRMVGLSYLDEGTRNFFTIKSAITRLSDIKGKKIRVQNSELMLDTVSALGANPTPIDYAELYSSLQIGAVDGAENPLASYYSNKFYKLAPYYVLDGHTYSPSVILCSEITWNKLSQEDQKVLLEASELTENYNKMTIEIADQKVYENLKLAGVTITELEDLEAWEQAMEPVYIKHGAQFLDLIEAIKAIK